MKVIEPAEKLQYMHRKQQPPQEIDFFLQSNTTYCVVFLTGCSALCQVLADVHFVQPLLNARSSIARRT